MNKQRNAYTNLDKLASYASLQDIGRSPRTRLTAGRILECDIPFVDSMRYNYAARLLHNNELAALTTLANEAQLITKYSAVISGEYINCSEDRMVLHHLLRGSLLNDVSSNGDSSKESIFDRDGKNIVDFYQNEREKVYHFSDKVRDGAIRASDGSRIEAVVQIGIGGSNLGPHALYEALRGWAVNADIELRIPAYFISNVDPDDALSVLTHIPVHSTLFVIVSKSGGTIETLTNAKIVEKFLLAHGVQNPKKQMVVVTSEASPLATDGDYAAHFFIDDHIGGRYSSCGAVGALVISIAFGHTTFTQLLDGAHQADRCALEPNPLYNPPLLDALCGVYERSILGYPAYAVLPYSQALHRFPAHIQQLDMESNGKTVNRFGEPVSYQTGALVFGEPGTNSQHSFYQLLHQGSTVVPAIFIAFSLQQRNSNKSPISKLTPTAQACDAAQKILHANVVAQICAFARGEESKNDLNKQFPGNRPSSLLYGHELNPFALGALLSFFENRVLFQGFLWNINSFDQEGVQLGKRLANVILSEDGKSDISTDPLLQNYQKIFSSVQVASKAQ